MAASGEKNNVTTKNVKDVNIVVKEMMQLTDGVCVGFTFT